ncbi:hypothetical protein CQW23_17730 [Capsicum baccatum]|uniref:Uncharacterized protein n=1 Tax=Capsicum baccatum TaxID=33114 RepID=A0A2G2WEN5_CAPBA|nr:hypothetical protein CQW23_17730 [Capsicum baccatum]
MAMLNLLLSQVQRENHQDQCILLEQDAKSRAQVEELKKELHKEASLALKTCGWSEEVYTLMRSKKLGAQSDFQASDINAMKKLLIADAKPMFISRIPESLKSSLVERLTSFSQGTPPPPVPKCTRQSQSSLFSPLTMVLIYLACILCHLEMGCMFVVTSILCHMVEKAADDYKLS